MTTKTLLLVGGAGLGAYLLLRPKAPPRPTSPGPNNTGNANKTAPGAGNDFGGILGGITNAVGGLYKMFGSGGGGGGGLGSMGSGTDIGGLGGAVSGALGSGGGSFGDVFGSTDGGVYPGFSGGVGGAIDGGLDFEWP